MMMTRNEATAIATIAVGIRPDWDHAGVLTALHKVRDRVLAEVARAAIAAALDHRNRTPAVIALKGPHWDTGTSTGAATTDADWRHPRPNDWCPTHPGQRAGSCGGCRADAIGVRA